MIVRPALKYSVKRCNNTQSLLWF